MLLRKIAVSVGVALGVAVACTPPASAVVGGSDATASTAPYQASVVVQGWFGSSHACGGALVGEKSVVTAAHCVNGHTPDQIKVKYGGLDRTHLAVTQDVVKISQHEGFNGALANDVAVLELSSPIEMTDRVKTIELASSTPAPGAELTVTGWGRTRPDANSLPTGLKVLRERLATPESCRTSGRGIRLARAEEGGPVEGPAPALNTRTMLCGAPVATGESLCTGDGGGPAVVDGVLVGIASWNSGCGRNGKDDIYTNVAVFRGWLERKIL